MELWQRFSRNARRAVLKANERVLKAGGGEITPEHLALGILDLEQGSAWEMLQGMRVNIPKLREALVDAAAMVPKAPDEEVQFSPQTQRCIQTAYVEWQKHSASGASAPPGRERPHGGEDPPEKLRTIHLLLGLVAPASRCECRTLIRHGVFYGEVSELLRRTK